MRCTEWKRNGSGQGLENGFTLMELMIVVIIVGVLAAMAYPHYTAYVQRGHRAEAHSALLDAQQFMERYYAAQGRYTSASGEPPALPLRLQTVPQGSTNDMVRYVLSVSEVTVSSYTLQAELSSGQEDSCGHLTLTHTGVKGRAGEAMSVQDCWR